MSEPEPFKVSDFFSPNDRLRDLPEGALGELRLKEAVLVEVDIRLAPIEASVKRVEERQDHAFGVLLAHATRKNPLTAFVSNTVVQVLAAVIALVLAVGYTKSDVALSLPGADVDIQTTEGP